MATATEQSEKPAGAPPQPESPRASAEAAVASATSADGDSDADSKPEQQQPSFLTSLSTYLSLLFRPTGPNPWPDTLLLFTGLLTAIAAGTPFPLMGIIFGELVDDINLATCHASSFSDSPSSDSPPTFASLVATAVFTKTINKKVLQLVYISLAAFALIYVYTSTWSLFSQRLSHRLREAYLRSLLRQDPTFFDSRHAGEVSARLNGDIQAIASGTGEKVGIFLASLSFFVTAYIVGFIKDAELAGILISLVPAFLIMSLTCGVFIQKFASIASDATATASTVLSEGLDNVGVVQTFGMGRRLEEKFATDMGRGREAGIKKAVVAAAQAGGLFFIAYSANALAFWKGSRKIADAAQGKGDSSVGEIYTVVFLLVDACVMLGSVAPLLPLFGGAAAAYRKLKDDIDTKSLIDGTSPDGDVLPNNTPASIEFRQTSFTYPSRPEHPVLKSVDLRFPAGAHTGIVGLSGSGKSTVTSLITRLYDVASGTILVNGKDIKSLNVRNLRSLIGLVPQEPSLLDRSVFENIALGLVNSGNPAHASIQPVLQSAALGELATKVHTNHPDEASNEIVRLVQHGADLAEVSTFIPNLENGWATRVGSGGQLVSGGQRQRIALARALVKDPRILVLDEATASLDSTTERKIQDAVYKVAANRTVISIAHRLSTVKDVDNIVVMRDGEVVEQGSHADLMGKDGAFAGMVQLQGLSSESDGASTSGESKQSLDEKIETASTVVEPAPATQRPKAVCSSSSSTTTPDSSTTPSKTPSYPFLQAFTHMTRPYLTHLLIAIISSIIVGCTFSASGLLFGHTVGALNPCANTIAQILYAGKFFGGMLFMLAIVELFANLVSWSAFGLIAERLVYRVRVLGFRALFEKGVEWHRAEGRSPASLLSIITKDSVALQGFSGSIVGTIFSICVNFLVAVVMSHIIAWKIALVFLVTVPILLGSGVMQIRAISRFEEQHAAAFSSAISLTVEAVSHIKTVASLGLESEILATYKRMLAAPKKAIVGASLYTNLWLAIANSTGFLIYAFAYWWGAKLILKGEYNQTQFFIILVAILVSAQLWGQMFSLAPEVTKAKAAAGRIVELIQSRKGVDGKAAFDGPENEGDDDVEAVAEAKAPVSNRGAGVEFEGVTFAYPSRPGAPVLEAVSFSIQPGKFVGLVGPSGAGKSTIMALAQQLYSPTSGSISIDGNTNLAAFKDDIAIVPQDSSLFSGSVSFNVSLGAREGHQPSGDEIKEACRLANIHEVVAALPEGYDTDCGPSASRLSGGQKQRLAIARALVRKPRLLLLDESTSALDAESEAAVQEGLARAVREGGVTVLAITHRLHTVMRADVILVVEGGSVVDRGSHVELVERCESYRQNALGQMLR